VSKTTAERRAHARFPKSFELESHPGPDGIVARMVARDLSLGGLYCSTSADLPEMTRLAVKLLLPDDGRSGSNGDAVDVEAVVVRRKKLSSATGANRFELALFFTSMSDNDRERLARFLAQP